MADQRLKAISDSIRVIPNFPKEGIMFQDVTTLLLNPEAFQYSVDILYEHYKDANVDVIAGMSILFNRSLIEFWLPPPPLTNWLSLSTQGLKLVD